MMVYNKLQGFSLVISFLVIFQLNVNSFDFAENILEAVEDVIAEEVGREDSFETIGERVAEELGGIAFDQEIQHVITKELGSEEALQEIQDVITKEMGSEEALQEIQDVITKEMGSEEALQEIQDVITKEMGSEEALQEIQDVITKEMGSEEALQEIQDVITKEMGGEEALQEIQDVITKELDVGDTQDNIITEEMVTDATIATIQRAVQDGMVSVADGKEIKNMIHEEIAKEADTQFIKKTTQKYLRYLPSLKVFQNGKIMGFIVAVVIAIAVMVKFWMGREPADWPKYMNEQVDKLMAKEVDKKLSSEEQNMVKTNKDRIKMNIVNFVRTGDTKPLQAKAKEFADKVKEAETALGVKVPEIFVILNGIASGKEIKVDAVNYLESLETVISEGKNKNITEQHKQLPTQYRNEFMIMCNDYSKAVKDHELAEKWLQVLRLPDSAIKDVHILTPVNEILKGK